MEISWNAAEEQLIAETMADGLSRIGAIQRLRSSWWIGETPPPMSRERRRMPKENPRYGQAVKEPTQELPEAPTQASFLGGEASTSTDTRLGAKRLQKAASIRQARWRAKKKNGAALPIGQAA
jgi:hypothetical protein